MQNVLKDATKRLSTPIGTAIGDEINLSQRSYKGGIFDCTQEKIMRKVQKRYGIAEYQNRSLQQHLMLEGTVTESRDQEDTYFSQIGEPVQEVYDEDGDQLFDTEDQTGNKKRIGQKGRLMRVVSIDQQTEAPMNPHPLVDSLKQDKDSQVQNTSPQISQLDSNIPRTARNQAEVQALFPCEPAYRSGFLDSATRAFSPVSSSQNTNEPIIRQFNVRSQKFEFENFTPVSKKDQHEVENHKLKPHEKQYLHSLKGKPRITSVSVITDTRLAHTSTNFKNTQNIETESQDNGFGFYDQHPLTDVADISLKISQKQCNTGLLNSKSQHGTRIKLAPLNFINADLVSQPVQDTNKYLEQSQILEKEMDETQRNMREAQFKLSRLMEADSKRHTIIQVGNPSPPTIVELYPSIPQYFKIECPVGCPSPIVINLKNMRGEYGKITDLEVFGSYREKEPGPKKHENKYKNPQRIEVIDPFGRKIFNLIKVIRKDSRKEGKDKSLMTKKIAPVYFIQMISQQTMTIKLQPRVRECRHTQQHCKLKQNKDGKDLQQKMSGTQKLQPSTDINNQRITNGGYDDAGYKNNVVLNILKRQLPSIEESDSDQDVNTVKKIPKLTVGSLQRKLKSDIKEIVADFQMSQKIITNTDKLISKKSKQRKSLDFQRNDRKTSIKGLKVASTPAAANKDLQTYNKAIEFANMGHENFGNLIERNKQKVSKYNPEVEGMVHRYKHQAKAYQIEMAKSKAAEKQFIQRNKHQDYINKWDDFKQFRTEIIDKYLYHRRRQEVSKMNIGLATAVVGLKYFREAFRREALKIRAKDRIRFIMVTAMFRYRRTRRKFGANQNDRSLNQIRNTFTFLTIATRQIIQMRTFNISFGPFISELRYREYLKMQHRNAVERIRFIQDRFKKQVTMNQARLEALQIFWRNMQNEFEFQKNKRRVNPFVKLMAKKLKYVKDNVRDHCLLQYLNACKYRHALAFFQWREHFSVQSDKGILMAVFQGRIKYLKEVTKFHQENYEIAEQKSLEESKALEELNDPDADVPQEQTPAPMGREYGARSPISSDSRLSSSMRVVLPNVARVKQIKKQLELTIEEQDEVYRGAERDNELERCRALNQNTINTFEEINWNDPFLNEEDQDKGKKLEDMDMNQPAYDVKSFNPLFPPSLTFVPSKVLMKKLMRVCTECKDEVELNYVFC